MAFYSVLVEARFGMGNMGISLMKRGEMSLLAFAAGSWSGTCLER
jgi:hypothetical protein